MYREILESPQSVIERINDIFGIYSMNIKCLGCSETGFKPYESLVVDRRKLVVGKRSYPIDLIEKIAVRYRDEDPLLKITQKVEEEYITSAGYLSQYLTDDAKKILEEFYLQEPG